jgi:UDP-N-acetylmuramate--alanine ligase
MGTKEDIARQLFNDPAVRSLHFIGIGGAGMSALAAIALDLGFRVTGSDLRDSPPSVRLRSRGAVIARGHSPRHLRGADRAIYSSAVPPDNPELAAARARSLPVLHRSELLAALTAVKRTVAVAGSHGKTSVSALLSWVLSQAGLRPSYAIGGDPIGLPGNGAWADGEWLVAEADESDGSFRRLSPTWEVIVNLDLDHVDRYPSWESLYASFSAFLDRLPPSGGVIAWGDDARLRALLPSARRAILYGEGEGVSVRAKDIRFTPAGSVFRAEKDGGDLGEISLGLWGRHNVLNALAVLALALEIGVPFSSAAAALAGFRGVKRRLETAARGEVLLVEDYSHHPAEVAAALSALRPAVGGRLCCVFQPHRYTRLERFAPSLASALLAADRLILAEVYPAFEKPRPGIDSALLLKELVERGRGDALLLGREEIVERAVSSAQPGDAIVVMGAGDIGNLVPRIAERLKRKFPKLNLRK